MKWYISGPISGRTDYEPKFEKAAEYIRGQGNEPVNPVMVGQSLILDRNKKGLCTPNWKDFMKADIAVLLSCDAILAIDDFWKSQGALLELRIADALGIPIYQFDGKGLRSFNLKSAWK
jgi:nucleoside 2-deoxyribosyltransferase